MAIATIKGWRCCVGRSAEGVTQFKAGDKCIYIPPDTILPVALAEKLNVAKYCAPVRTEKPGTDPVEYETTGYRVQVSRLRGEPSYGFPMAVPDESWEVGRDVVGDLGLSKWEPPLDCTDGDAERPHPAFHTYFNLENINNFPELLKEGEEVVFTEKIHGKNCRVGLIRDTKDDGTPIWRFMAGSHDVRRKEMSTQRKRKVVRNPDGSPLMESQAVAHLFPDAPAPEKDKEVEWFYEVTKKSQFWEVLDRPGVRDLLLDVCNGQNNVVVFGEIYGSGVQDMAYGFQNGQWGFRVFDIAVNGKYLGVDEKFAACKRHVLETVPLLYRGPFSQAKVDEFVGGPTTVCDPANAGSFKEREGIVITTVVERSEATEKKFFDRAAVKAINFKYLERKGGTEYH